ncbi:MAG: hypothetical protein V3V81_08040 [Candidatus Bathyarchaeia archaeon]
MKEQRGERERLKGIQDEELKLKRLGVNLDLQEVARKRRGEELAPRIAAQKKAERETVIGGLPPKVQPFARAGMTVPKQLYEQIYGTGEEEELGRFKDIDKEKKVKWTTDQRKVRITKVRLNKEIATLTRLAKPDKEERELGEISDEKKAFLTQIQNIQNSLDLVGDMERYMVQGTPLGKRMSSALSGIMNDFPRALKGVKSGELLGAFRASWAKEADLTPTAPQRKQFRNKKTGQLDWFRWDAANNKWIKE